MRNLAFQVLRQEHGHRKSSDVTRRGVLSAVCRNATGRRNRRLPHSHPQYGFVPRPDRKRQRTRNACQFRNSGVDAETHFLQPQNQQERC
jgi:hypothetical protein